MSVRKYFAIGLPPSGNAIAIETKEIETLISNTEMPG
jgi:hypothetical protein